MKVLRKLLGIDEILEFLKKGQIINEGEQRYYIKEFPFTLHDDFCCKNFATMNNPVTRPDSFLSVVMARETAMSDRIKELEKQLEEVSIKEYVEVASDVTPTQSDQAE